MASDAPDGTFFRLSTDQLPEGDRVALWREVIARQAMRIDSEPLLGAEFRVDVRGRMLPGLMVARAQLGGLRDSRTPSLVADGQDELNLLINLAGPVLVSARGTDTALGEGEAIVMSSAEPNVVTRPSQGLIIGITMPRNALATHIPDLNDALARVIPAQSEALKLLKGYLAMLVDDRNPTSPEVCQAVVGHVSELVALALGAARGEAQFAGGRGVAAARLRAIKADIVENMMHRDLTIAWLARRHRLSERYIQMLFETEQTTFSQFLLEQRLEQVHQALGDARFATRSISELAYHYGFGDLSYFNRTFRRRYLVTPSERRAGATKPD